MDTPGNLITFIDQTDISSKRVLLRVDCNVSLNPNHTIADDARIRQSLPTIKYLLEKGNKLILVSHLGRPEGRDAALSLKPVQDRLQKYLQDYKVTLVNDFLTTAPTFENDKEILLLENIRFYPEEQKNDSEFAKKLASLADVFVNDAFGVSHRADASVVGVTKFLPSYGGLLLKKEIEMISKVIDSPEKPVVAILGGAKISSKIGLIDRLMEQADYLILGGGIANTLLSAQGIDIGKSLVEKDAIPEARKLLDKAMEKNTMLVLPLDVITSPDKQSATMTVKSVTNVSSDEMILDIGPETQAHYGAIIGMAKTIIWNGPVGYFENPVFCRGTDFIYYAITENTNAVSIVGGGDTLAAIAKEEYLEKITHISTGGGAMLEFIENGTLPGIEALISSA